MRSGYQNAKLMLSLPHMYTPGQRLRCIDIGVLRSEGRGGESSGVEM